MISLTDKERLELLGEVFLDELRVIREYLSDIPLIKQDITGLQATADKHSRLHQAHSYEIRLLRNDIADIHKSLSPG